MRRFFFLFICLSLLFLTVGCATDKAVISQAEQAHGGLKPAVINDPQLAGYLQSIGQRIITTAHEMDGQHFGPDSHRKEDSSWMFSNQMQFHFVNSQTLNAFTTGGDHMYIYTALFQQCKSEDELAAVMCHEYAHVYARHVHKGMNRQYVMTGGVVTAGLVGLVAGGQDKGQEYSTSFAGAAAAAGQFIGMGYTRGDEAEADQLGFQFYARSGWDPNKFGDFFQHMIDKGYDKTPELLSDHPSLKSRVEASRQYASQLPSSAPQWRRAPVADARQFAALQSRTTQFARSMPNDKSLQQAQTLLASFPSCVASEDMPEQKAARKRLEQMLKVQK